MIRNIVFDIGNVLIYFRPQEYMDNFGFEQSVKYNVYNCIFKSKYWLELDRGTLSEEEAVELFCKEAPNVEKEIRKVMEAWKDILLPIPETIALIKELKQKGYKVFVLSNYHKKAFEKIYSENEFFKLLDGKVISYEVNYIKPEREIYDYFLNTYDLKPEETLFIDDTYENIEGAAKLGINTILFDGIDKLKENLKELNII